MSTEPGLTKESIRILIVDDQPGMRLTLGGILKRRGYNVTMVEDGYHAIEEVKKSPINIVFMDIKMPGMDGVETFVKMKEINPRITAVMMTAFAMEEQMRRAIQEGAYAVIYKPFEIEKILAIIEEYLEAKTMILVVDDAFEERAYLKKILERNNYKVIDIHSGYECIKMVQERRFDLVFMDVKMPGMDGMETLLKVREVRPDIPVIMVTAFSGNEIEQQALQTGAYACLNKPYDVQKVLQIIEKCLKRNEEL